MSNSAYSFGISPTLQAAFQRAFPGCVCRSYLIHDGELSIDLTSAVPSALDGAGFVSMEEIADLPPCGIRHSCTRNSFVARSSFRITTLMRQKRGILVSLWIENDHFGPLALKLRQMFNVESPAAARVGKAPFLRLVVNNKEIP
jgi:hypothetical protein